MQFTLALLKSANVPANLRPLNPKWPGNLTLSNPKSELISLLSPLKRGDLLSLDFETKGDYADVDSYPVGVGLANSQGSVYISLVESHPDTLLVLARILSEKQIRLIAHNAFFDAGWFMRDLSQSFEYRPGLGSKEPGCWLNWHVCTYALYRLLASEGYPGQQYGLKKAQVDLLGWPSSNETGLDCWLIENDHVGNISKVAKEGYYFYPNYALGSRAYSTDAPEVPGEHDRWVSPKKEMMYLAPPGVLGEYCRLDAQSTYDLYTHVLEPALARFEGLQWYTHELYMRFIYLLVWQKISGITIDQEALNAHQVSLRDKIVATKKEFLEHPNIAPHIAAYNRRILDEHLAKEPKRIKGEWPPNPPTSQYKKDGTETAAWQTYQAKLSAGPEISKNWIRWSEALSELQNQNQFNLNSGPQRAWLFYEQLGYPIKSTTESGLPATDETALRQFGEPGKLLSEYISLEKELGFNASLRQVINPDTGRYHPSFRVPGTHTGRLAGAGGFNCFTSDAEYLTPFGWVNILELQEGTPVWQVDAKTKQGSWAVPSNIIKREYSGEIYAFGGTRGELFVTPEHRMAWYGAINQDFKYLDTSPAYELPDTTRAIMLHSSFSDSVSSHTKEEIWKAAAVQADGTRIKRRGKYTDKWRIGVRKLRKIEKLTELFGEPTYIYPQVTVWDFTFQSDLLNTQDKTLNLTKLGTAHAAVLVEAISFWDGTVIKEHTVEYSSVVERNIDELQAYLCRAGYSATKKKYKNCYRLYITKTIHKEIRLHNPQKKQPIGVRTDYYSGMVGCVTVQHGHILVRQSGRIWVTGNCQNPPKSLDFLRAFTVPEGYVIVTCDHASLEDYVLAELSRDASLWDFYATGKKGNCMYLSVGSRLPVLGQKIREAGYDPENWTPESVKAAKKTANKWRQVAKKIVLSANYGAGPGKIHASLLEDGIDISIDEVYKMHKGFWELRKGVKVWEQELKRQWKDNGGWLLNGFGRPICLEPMREKDLVNSQGQSVGHDCHVLFQILTAEHLTANKFDWMPWHMDLHDCLMFAVKKEEAERAVDLLKNVVYPELNRMLGGSIPLKGEPNVCRSWADDKDEEFNWQTNEKLQAYLRKKD